MDKVIGKHLKKLSRQEDKLLEQPGGTFMKPLTDKVEDKIPEELYNKLQQAFYIGFKTVFEKGNGIIEKTYDRDKLMLDHEVYDASFEKINKLIIRDTDFVRTPAMKIARNLNGNVKK